MKKENQDINDALLAKFLTEDSSSSEQEKILTWLEASPENRKHLDQLEQVWLESGKLNPRPISVHKQNAWQKLSKRIAHAQSQEKKKRRIRFYLPIAASIAIIIGMFTWLQLENSNVLAYKNSSNEVEKHLLPDHSEVHMNQQSELKYLSSSNDHTRQVKMKGEIFYQIKRDTSKAFIIDAGVGKVKVLGTSFNVKIKDNKDIEVSVNSGTVEIYHKKSKQNNLILHAGESGIISNKKKIAIKKTIHPTAFFWMNKKLIFQSISLKEIFNILEECYQVKIVSENEKINTIHYSSNFMDNDIHEILEIISKTCEFKVDQEKENYTITALHKSKSDR